MFFFKTVIVNVLFIWYHLFKLVPTNKQWEDKLNEEDLDLALHQHKQQEE